MGRKGARDRKGRPRSNRAQNRQVKDAASAMGLSDDQRWTFRRRVELESREQGADLSYDDLMSIAGEVKNGV
ncbi:hypothetical protein [uncultured Brevundimonas sp.]|uniref:hypothetical protein n=1 Tax=uncultured Brevundimonas sp. TaxID=213418 RepID=UPI00263741A4|nr:hypothetical protein [uncultured Brevundimonas sp.]